MQTPAQQQVLAKEHHVIDNMNAALRRLPTTDECRRQEEFFDSLQETL